MTKLFLVALFLFFGLLVGGFFKFSSAVTAYSVPDNFEPVQGIVVVTGGAARIERAVEILSNGKGKRLLISGVYKETRLKDLRARSPEQAALFDCCVDVEHLAMDTVGNAVETEKWLKKNGYTSMVLVTSNYHMPRSLLEFRRQMPTVVITPYPVIALHLDRQDWWKDQGSLRLMISEYLKYVGAAARDFIKPNVLNTLQASMARG